MILNRWPFEPLNDGVQPDGPPDDGGRPGIPH